MQQKFLGAAKTFEEPNTPNRNMAYGDIRSPGDQRCYEVVLKQAKQAYPYTVKASRLTGSSALESELNRPERATRSVG